MAYKNILTKVHDGAFWIRFNRPKRRNAISFDTYAEIIDALHKAEKDATVAVTVFTGEGEFYSSGNDFHPDELARNFEGNSSGKKPPFASLVDVLIDHPKPLIALVNGPAIGISCTILGLFEMVIAADTAYFSTPFPQLGVCPEGCSSVTFPILMGYAK
uniref:Uncharacterized protein n=1 Tax=Plectus sambesii TaxID=2011161 RepID=A0A914WID0_9BILA